MTEHLAKSNWASAVNKTNAPLLTSDQPVYFNKRAGVSKSDLTFPISTKVVLIIYNEIIPTGYQEMSDRFLQVFNRRAVAQAVKYIFAPINADWIVRMGFKTYPERLLVEN